MALFTNGNIASAAPITRTIASTIRISFMCIPSPHPIGRAPPVVTLRPGDPDAAGPGQVPLRHTKRLTYRCFLPDLAGLVMSSWPRLGPRCFAHQPDPVPLQIVV